MSIIGHNGSGKSTLSKLIDGILVQNKGEIYIDGIKRNDDNALLLRKRLHLSSKIRTASSSELPSGMILPLDLRTNAFLHKIGTPLSKKVQKKSEGKSISIENLRIFRVDRNNELPSQTALPVIRKSWSDEAGARLDPKGKHEIRKIIYERKKKDPNLTILNITHEIDEAYDSDRVLVRNKGKLVLDGTPEEVFQDDAFLASIHLDIPFAHKLNKKLKELGLDYGKVKNDYELREKICQSH